jgi:nitroimidazol reductase NimA-like FMN-containing flavoprotein (pyridoxamine 5'-phosphate oxidase superfamily)
MSDDGINAKSPTSLRGDLRRADKVMSVEEAVSFLTGAFCGRTATVGSDGYPYVVPNLFVWMDDRIYRICFEADEPGETFPYGPVECDTSISYTSVVVFGRITIVTDDNVKQRFYQSFMHKYAPKDSWGRVKGSFPRMGSTVVYAIQVETMSGKRSPLPAVDKQWRKSTLAQ